MQMPVKHESIFLKIVGVQVAFVTFARFTYSYHTFLISKKTYVFSLEYKENCEQKSCENVFPNTPATKRHNSTFLGGEGRGYAFEQVLFALI